MQKDRLCKALFKMSVQNNFIININLYKKDVALCLLGSGSTKPRHEGEAVQLLCHADRKAHTSEGNCLPAGPRCADDCIFHTSIEANKTQNTRNAHQSHNMKVLLTLS